MIVQVNPNILIWAREESGMTIESAAAKLKIQPSSLTTWEKKGEVTYAELTEIAKLYKRQSAVFFLNDVPLKTKKPKIYRNLAIGQNQFSPETMLAIRRTERYLKVARETNTREYWNEQYSWLKNFTGKKENIDKEVSLLRDILKIKVEYKTNKPEDYFRKLRKIIEEKLGIFVFQFPMNESELDGFSYAFDEFPYAIVVNNKHAAVKKNFTLFHELAHLLKHDPAVCKNDFNEKNLFPIELECNNFAGKFLVPKELLQAVENVEKIFIFAQKLNISGEVYLRRLAEEHMVTRDQFFVLLEEVRIKSNSFKKIKPDAEGGPTIVTISKSMRGAKFFETVTVAAMEGKINYSTASDLLGLKVGHIHL